MRACIAAGAATIEEIGERCRAGTQCGGCHANLARLLGEAAIARRAEHHSAA